MKAKRALQVILSLAIAGVLFSGYLSYQELFGGTLGSCPAPGAPGTVLGYPACVYGFLMFVVIAVMAALGLRGPADQRTIVRPRPLTHGT